MALAGSFQRQSSGFEQGLSATSVVAQLLSGLQRTQIEGEKAKLDNQMAQKNLELTGLQIQNQLFNNNLNTGAFGDALRSTQLRSAEAGASQAESSAGLAQYNLDQAPLDRMYQDQAFTSQNIQQGVQTRGLEDALTNAQLKHQQEQDQFKSDAALSATLAPGLVDSQLTPEQAANPRLRDQMIATWSGQKAQDVLNVIQQTKQNQLEADRIKASAEQKRSFAEQLFLTLAPFAAQGDPGSQAAVRKLALGSSDPSLQQAAGALEGSANQRPTAQQSDEDLLLAAVGSKNPKAIADAYAKLQGVKDTDKPISLAEQIAAFNEKRQPKTLGDTLVEPGIKLAEQIKAQREGRKPTDLTQPKPLDEKDYSVVSAPGFKPPLDVASTTSKMIKLKGVDQALEARVINGGLYPVLTAKDQAIYNQLKSGTTFWNEAQKRLETKP